MKLHRLLLFAVLAAALFLSGSAPIPRMYTPARVLSIEWRLSEKFFVYQGDDVCVVGAPDKAEWSELGLGIRYCFDGQPVNSDEGRLIKSGRVKTAKIEWQRVKYGGEWSRVFKLCKELGGNPRLSPSTTGCTQKNGDRYIVVAEDAPPWDDLGHEAAHAFCGLFFHDHRGYMLSKSANACVD